MKSYNYDEFSTEDYDFDTVDGPDVGQKAPDSQLTTSEGEKRNLLDFSGDFLVLEMGSITCPLFQSRRTIMQRLERDFNDVIIAVLYVREAHPGARTPSHKSFEDKLACARRLKNDDHETRTIFIDDVDGTTHQAYGGMPNAVFIINKFGCVVFRSEWNNPSATRTALISMIEGRQVTTKSFFRPPVPTVVFRTFKGAGKGSALDFFKGLPYLIWTNLVKRNLRLLFNKPVNAHADTKC